MNLRSLFLIAFTLALAGCGRTPRETQAASGAPASPLAVQTVAATFAEFPSTYEALGTVRARTSAVIAAKLMGYVREVKVQTGDRVEQGQALIALDARDLDAAARRAEAVREEIRSAVPEADSAVAAAKAGADLAQVTFSRIQDLYTKKSVSNQEFDEAFARLKSAQAAYEMARAKRVQLDSRLQQAEQDVRTAEVMRSYAEIAAPFAGIIVSKPVNPGDLATPGAPLLTIERDGSFRLEAEVEESRLAAVRMGQAVTVRLDAPQRTVEGRVTEIVPAVDAQSRAGLVKIDLPDMAGLRSGAFGRVLFPAGRRRVIAIPAGAVIERGQLQSIFVADQGVARIRLLTLGQRDRDRVEVLSGLSEGEKVIFPQARGLADGARVEAGP